MPNVSANKLLGWGAELGGRTGSRQSIAVAEAAERTAQSVQTVAAATEELSSSILEIGRQAETSAEVAAEAVSESRDTTGIVKGLSNED